MPAAQRGAHNSGVPRRVSNPPNPWQSQHVEYLGEAPLTTLEVYEEQARTIVATNDSPDVPFRYSVNPYRGCQHACAYCYARTSHQYLDFGAGTDFDAKIVVKRNAPELLRDTVGRRTWKRDWIAFSGVTDCYQPLEASYQLTRRCLEVCRDYRVAIGVVTKSALVRRDAELIAEIGTRAASEVFVSIPFADERQARAIEPWAPTPTQRFETLRLLHAAGVPVGVAIAPIIPGLNESQVPEILERAREAGATRAFPILLRLTRELRPIFEQRLRAALPARAERVLHALDEMRSDQRNSDYGTRMCGSGARWKTVIDLFAVHCRKLGLAMESEDAHAPLRRGPLGRVTQHELFDQRR